MRRRFYLLLCWCFWTYTLLAAKKRISYITIQGHITQTSNYCGGARPSEDVLKELHTPHAFAGKVLYIKQGWENSERIPVITRVSTDSNGDFTVRLRADKAYMFLEEWKAQPLVFPKDTEFYRWDTTCIRQRYRTPDFFLARGEQKPVQINFHQPCFYAPYCGTYSGPLPP